MHERPLNIMKQLGSMCNKHNTTQATYDHVFVEPERAIIAADFMVGSILRWVGRGFALILLCFVCRAMSTFKFRQITKNYRRIYDRQKYFYERSIKK